MMPVFMSGGGERQHRRPIQSASRLFSFSSSFFSLIGDRRLDAGLHFVRGFLIVGTPIVIFVLNDSMEVHMAGNLHVRNLEDELIAKLKTRAARHGRSAEAEHREILRQALETEVEPSFDELAAQLRRLTAQRKQTPSEVLLREGRDER